MNDDSFYNTIVLIMAAQNNVVHKIFALVANFKESTAITVNQK